MTMLMKTQSLLESCAVSMGKYSSLQNTALYPFKISRVDISGDLNLYIIPYLRI